MNKIFFLIPFFMLGCSTPEIYIPSYDFSNDTNSSTNVNEPKETLFSIDKIENNKDIDIVLSTKTQETQDIQDNIQLENNVPLDIISPHAIPIKEVKAPTTPVDLGLEKVKIPDDLALEEAKEIPENISLTKPTETNKKTTNVNNSTSFFSSLFKPKKKIKNEYFTGGKIRSKLVMSDDTGESGLLYRYGYEGKVTSTVHMKHGLKNGLETLFDEKGRVMKRTPFVSGKKDGIVEVYYADGKVLAQIAYVDNKRHGRASKYNHDGTTNEEVHYEQGKVQTQDREIEIPTID